MRFIAFHVFQQLESLISREPLRLRRFDPSHLDDVAHTERYQRSLWCYQRSFFPGHVGLDRAPTLKKHVHESGTEMLFKNNNK